MSSRTLNHALLNQALGYVREGNMRRARSLGFNDEELRELRRMSATELDALASEGAVICRLAVDHSMLMARIYRLTQDQDRESQIDRCLELGASVQMMADFFGLTGNDCSTRRALLGLESRQGRLAQPPEDEEHAAWHRWQAICPHASDPQRAAVDLQGMMALAEETRIPLAVIWHLVKSWASPDQPRSELPPDDQDEEATGGPTWVAM